MTDEFDSVHNDILVVLKNNCRHETFTRMNWAYVCLSDFGNLGLDKRVGKAIVYCQVAG